MIYIIQDKKEDPKAYIGSGTTEAAMEDLRKELEEQDREAGEYEPGRYVIRRRGICYNPHAKKCGNCTNSICMLQDPDIDCPLVRKRAAMMAADQAGNQPPLKPAT